METSLLQTKLYIPSPRPELVPRPRLIELLNAGLHRKLTLISAPAGFGKTTLVSEWVANLRLGAMSESAPAVAIAWLSLDESDNDLTRFLIYLIGALQAVEVDIGKGVLSALQSPQPPPAETILTALINEIAALACRILLVLDDYHLIETQPIHDALVFLLRRLPPQMHVVIATREDPPLSLARLRARGQLTELRAADLKFAPSETAQFLNQVMGLDLSEEDMGTLERRTEGWIAGLQLAAISMQGHRDMTGFIQSFAGSHHYVLDYLVEEVLEQQSESIQSFLLQTAILDRLTGSLCDAVCGASCKDTGQKDGSTELRGASCRDTASGQQTLEMLEHANLFIVSLDNERRWYRYHHLFADLLRQRLHQTQPDQLPILHLRASEWYEQNGFVDEAIEHALRADHFERVAHLLEEHIDALWGRGEHTGLQNWLVKLPSELLFSNPHLTVFHAWFFFSSGQLEASERSLQAVERSLDSWPDRATETESHKQDSMTGSDKRKLRGRVATIRAFLAFYRTDIPGIIQHARQALEYLPEQDLTWRSIAAVTLGDAHNFKGDMTAAYEARLEALKACKAAGDIYFIMVASLKVAMTLRAQGRLQRTIEVCQQQMQLASKSGLSQTKTVGWLLAVWGETLAELNDLDRAVHLAKKGFKLAERSGNLQMLGWCYICLVRILFSMADLAGAKDLTQEMENVARESNLPSWTTDHMAAWQARMWLAQGRLDDASHWAVERGLDADGDPTYLHEIEYIALARILIAQGRLDETIRLLSRLLKAAEAGGHTSRAIEILMLQALTSRAKGETIRAMNVLERALALAQPEGFVRIFVDEGPSMSRLLYEALTRGIAPDYVRRLLAAFPVTEPEQTDVSKNLVSNSELIEPLSERELEVLVLFAEGLTNREVASRLFLALNTVKAHAGNIYGKLNVHSRTQAIARAQALGLLPPK
jgi:ATP/maltotriose-dependent transcriptional regulator MalT